MARSIKGSHRIEVRDTEYRWRARGTDCQISVAIWPRQHDTHAIRCRFGYHETRTDAGGAVKLTEQLVVTNRLVRRVLEYAIDRLAYDPATTSADLLIYGIEDLIDCSDAVRASK